MERNLIVITLQTMFQADFISALGHDLPQDGVCVCYLRMCVCWCLTRPSSGAPPLTPCHMVISGPQLHNARAFLSHNFTNTSWSGQTNRHTHTSFFTADLSI